MSAAAFCSQFLYKRFKIDCSVHGFVIGLHLYLEGTSPMYKFYEMIKRRSARIRLGRADVALLPGSLLDDAVRRGIEKAAKELQLIVRTML